MAFFSSAESSKSSKFQMFLFAFGSMSFKLIFHLGPIVDFKNAAVKYLPFKVAGLLSAKALINSLKFIRSCSSVKSILPIKACKFLPESTLNVTCPAFASLIFCPNSSNFTNVPTFAFGIKPFGPKAFPKCLIFPRLSLVEKSFSKSKIPFSSWT